MYRTNLIFGCLSLCLLVAMALGVWWQSSAVKRDAGVSVEEGRAVALPATTTRTQTATSTRTQEEVLPIPSPSIPVVPTPSVKVPSSVDSCTVGGCSGQLCGEASAMEDMVTTCEWTEQYACYQRAQCARQTDGRCGWTNTPDLQQCLESASR